MEHGYSREITNLNLFEHPFPSRLGMDDEFIPNAMFDLRIMPMFVTKHFVIPLDPNGPQCNAPKGGAKF